MHEHLPNRIAWPINAPYGTVKIKQHALAVQSLTSGVTGALPMMFQSGLNLAGARTVLAAAAG